MLIGARLLLCIVLHVLLIEAFSKKGSECIRRRFSVLDRDFITRKSFRLLAIKTSDSFITSRNFTHLSNILLFICLSLPDLSNAKELSTTEYLPIYRSGKNPEAFSNSNKDSKVGTKKDINFLRCMSNCKSQCQLPGEGLVKTDCVQDCQDQCCDSYEQCSFKIKINTGNTI